MVKKDFRKKKPPRQTDVLENLQVNSSKTLQLPTARMLVSILQAKAIKKFSPGRTQFGKRWQEVDKYATRVFLRHIKHFPFRHRAAKMTRTIAFYTTFTPRHRDGQDPPKPPAVRRGKFSCPTSQSRFQFKYSNKKEKIYACQTHSFSIHLGVGREQASVNKNKKKKKKRKETQADVTGGGSQRSSHALYATEKSTYTHTLTVIRPGKMSRFSRCHELLSGNSLRATHCNEKRPDCVSSMSSLHVRV